MMANANQKGALIMNYDYRVTGQIIGRLRVQREMSQEALSGLAGIARSHLAMIENGRKKANVETLWRIAAALDMRMSELMRMVEDEMDRMSHVTKPRFLSTEPETFGRDAEAFGATQDRHAGGGPFSCMPVCFFSFECEWPARLEGAND